MIGWLDCSSGVSGDMLLAALVDAGVSVTVMQAAVDAVSPEPVRFHTETVSRGGLRATRVQVEVADSVTHRTWADIRALVEHASLEPAVRDIAVTTFAALAGAEATVHGTNPEDVHFHEVGALDSIADVVGVAAGFAVLGLDVVHASPIAVGAGTVRTEHGLLPVPAPAVVELLRDVPSHGGGVAAELTTPTGAALLAATVATFGDQPAMRVQRQAVGAGARDLETRPNVLRLLIGDSVDTSSAALLDHAVVLAANVDDMDPRLWPMVLEKLLGSGASDAWLVPILMKKGRPAHTLCVLVEPEVAEHVRAVMFAETTTIGIREAPVLKHPLSRDEHTVTVDGHQVRVKTATLGGVLVNTQPEYDDVAAVAAATERPVKEVMAAAIAAARDAGFMS